ncbi:MAG: hemolysin III family protein [Parachlamydiaceae bacterium]|nr:hemolysin III family protein [Parachlamydiaceae bacterium]
MIEDIEKQWSLGDEWANSLTHGIGFVLSLVGFMFLLQSPMMEGNHWKLFSFTIYGFSLVLLYGASTFYHACKNRQLKHALRLLDHCAIYILIAGSYTPFTLVSMQGFWGWTLFALVWMIAIVGIIFKCFYIGRFVRLSTCLYLAMGWLIVIAIEPLMNSLSFEGLCWIAAGGLFYTSGIIFFLLDAKRFFHAIWHLFVLGGSVCHFFAVLLHT